MNELNEISTEYGVDVCAIIYTPSDTSQPEVWPNMVGAQRVLERFKKMPETEQYKEMMNQESFMKQRITEANEKIKKIRKENHEKEMTHVMYQCMMGRGFEGLSLADINDLRWLAGKKIKEIQKRIESLKKAGHSTVAPPPEVEAPALAATAAPPPNVKAPTAATAPMEAREVVDVLTTDGTQMP
ncbi:hypothetical protein LguiA_008314 [Lonicera macranthoides]